LAPRPDGPRRLSDARARGRRRWRLDSHSRATASCQCVSSRGSGALGDSSDEQACGGLDERKSSLYHVLTERRGRGSRVRARPP
jgi:hypothetical protein